VDALTVMEIIQMQAVMTMTELLICIPARQIAQDVEKLPAGLLLSTDSRTI